MLALAAVFLLQGILDGSGISIAWGIGLPVFLEAYARFQLREYRSGDRTLTVTITDTEYRTEGQKGVIARDWSTFKNVRRVSGFWVLRRSGTAAMALPADVLNTAQTQQFEDLMRRKGLLRR